MEGLQLYWIRVPHRGFILTNHLLEDFLSPNYVLGFYWLGLQHTDWGWGIVQYITSGYQQMCSFTFFKALLPSQLGLLSTLFKTEALRTLLPGFFALYFSQLINAIILFFICVACVICLYARSLIICAWVHFDVPNKAQVASKHLINIYIINKL